MNGGFFVGRWQRSNTARDGENRSLVRFLAVALLGILCATLSMGSARAEDAAGTPAGCGGTVTPASPESRQIALVIDDSGSMFANKDTALDRWSYAKYSLEVMAAMLEENDNLSVYRTSDFAKGAAPGPRVQLAGSEPVADRVAKIHSMDLQGGRTPYAPVQDAVSDLGGGDAQTRWLVILSDGAFNDRESPAVAEDLRAAVAANSTEDRPLKVAFLGIGEEAPILPNEPENGIYFAHAATSTDLLQEMTGFSNRIFERNIIKDAGGSQISPDVALSEALVFAQGSDVEIGSAQTSSGEIAPISVVDVSWADNPPIHNGGTLVPAVPNKDLRGKLATYQNLPKGDITFDVSGAQTVDVFYKPKVDFGVQLVDANGEKVAADKIVGGEYTLNYGFMDENCDIIASDLLGEVTYSARVIQNGKVVADNFKSGDTIDLKRGDAQLEVKATYLGGNTSKANIDVRVLQPATPVTMQASKKSYDASKLDSYVSPKDAIGLTIVATEGGVERPLTTEEWARVTPKSIDVTSDKNLEFDVTLGQEPGQVYILPKAPGGDVYAADTGEIPIHVTYSETFDEQRTEASTDTTTTVVDDLSGLDRFMNWLKTVGWKWLLLLLVVIVVAGYLFKKRFSKRIRPRPTISGSPKTMGVSPVEGRGRFTENRLRKFLPFVADTATLVYVPPGTPGFKPMKLKATRRKQMTLTNWQEIAKRNNVEVNGTELTGETKKFRPFGPNSNVRATTSKMTFDMTLSQ